MTPSEHREMLACAEHVTAALRADAENRAARRAEGLDWQALERRTMAWAANRWASRHGRAEITVDDIRRIESLAVGHIDYSTKIGLYVAELVYGVRQ